MRTNLPRRRPQLNSKRSPLFDLLLLLNLGSLLSFNGEDEKERSGKLPSVQVSAENWRDLAAKLWNAAKGINLTPFEVPTGGATVSHLPMARLRCRWFVLNYGRDSWLNTYRPPYITSWNTQSGLLLRLQFSQALLYIFQFLKGIENWNISFAFQNMLATKILKNTDR